jgi:DNA-binding ferritin-like protein (Dps family)
MRRRDSPSSVNYAHLFKEGKQDDSNLADLLVKDIVSLIQSLIDKLRETIKGLEEQEIKSANDFADFKTNLLGNGYC